METDTEEPANEHNSIQGTTSRQDTTSSSVPLSHPHSLSANVASFKRTPIPEGASVSERLKILCQDLEICENLLDQETRRRTAAETHCTLLGLDLITTKKRLNTKEKKSKKKQGRFSSSAKFLTSADARAEREKRHAEKAQREQQEAEKKARALAKENENQDRRAQLISDPTLVFSGSLKRKTKQELEDILFFLGISLKGKNSEQIEAIVNKLCSRPSYSKEPRFCQLWPTLDRDFPLPDAPPNSHNTLPIPGPLYTIPQSPLPQHTSLPPPFAYPYYTTTQTPSLSSTSALPHNPFTPSPYGLPNPENYHPTSQLSYTPMAVYSWASPYPLTPKLDHSQVKHWHAPLLTATMREPLSPSKHRTNHY